MTTRKPSISKSATMLITGVTALLAGCSTAIVQSPNYHVAEVRSFKVSGAPSQVMLMEIHDANNTLPETTWANTLSNRGYPPRLTYVTDADDIAPNQTIKTENRLVAVVNPTNSSMGDTLCTAPESLKTLTASDRINVRFGFCANDSIISETKASFRVDSFAEQLDSSASIINVQLFPNNMQRSDNGRPCSPMLSFC